MSDTPSEEQNAKLLPCPFCGAAARKHGNWSPDLYECGNEECALGQGWSWMTAEAWNRRIEAPGQSPEMERA